MQKEWAEKLKRKNNLVKLEIPSKRSTSFAENLQPEKKKSYWEMIDQNRCSFNPKFWGSIALVHLFYL